MTANRPSSNPDPGRYPWRFDVVDAFGKERVLGIGAERGRPQMTGPQWWTTDPDTGDRIAAAWAAACDRARQQRQP